MSKKTHVDTWTIAAFTGLGTVVWRVLLNAGDFQMVNGAFVAIRVENPPYVHAYLFPGETNPDRAIAAINALLVHLNSSGKITEIKRG
jgi:hypothetical protein